MSFACRGSFAHLAISLAIADRSVREPSMPYGPKAPKSGPSSNGRHRGKSTPRAPPANEIRFQRRMSSGAVMRPSSGGRPTT